MVEAHANSTEDYLIEGLSFKLAPGASYVTNRRSVSFFPSGSDSYSPASGVKVIKLKLNGGSEWLDPSTVKVMFTLNNTSGSGNMTLLSGPHAFFRRMRILCGGQIVEDIDDYNRVCEMMNVLSSTQTRTNDAVEGAPTWDSAGGAETLAHTKKRTMGMKLLSGLMNQNKMLPIKYAPIEVELELVNQATDAQQGATSWTITDVQLKCDLVTLDNALDNSYAAHLLAGKSLPINYSTYISQSQVTTASTFSINIARAATRLKSIFMNMIGAPSTTHTTNIKDFNNFWHPMSTGTTPGEYDAGLETEIQVQIGSKLFPEYPIRSASETFSQLRKTMGIHQSPFHSLDITPDRYRDYKFIAAIDTEKVLEAGFTGLNTRAGDLMTIKVQPVDASGMGSTKPTKFFTVLHTDNILEVKDVGVTVFD